MPASATESERLQSAVTRTAETLMATKKDILAAIAKGKDDTALFILIEDELNYIQSTLQAIANARGITNPTVAELHQEAPAEAARPLQSNPAPKATSDTPQPSRRKHSDAFDLALVAALHISEQLTYDVGLDMLLQTANALDPASERPSLTSKLNRWKKDGYVRWVKSSKMYLTPQGFTLYKEKVRACARPFGGLEDVTAALNKVFGISPNFDVVLTAR